MPSATLTRTTGGSRIVKFNDGEGLTHDDLNLSQDLTELRSVAWPLYTRMALNPQGSITDAGAQALLASQADTINRAFTFGGGALFAVTGTQTTCVRGGIIAAYDQAAKPLAAAASLNQSSSPLRLFYVGESTDGTEKVEFTHDLNAGGSPRVDMVSVKFTVIDDETLSRDFKDATTGAITTVSTAKRSNIQAQFIMRQGVDPTTPGSLPADEHLLYTVKMPSLSGVLSTNAMNDWTYPLGRRSIHLCVPATSYTVENTGDWVPTGLAYIQSSAGSKKVYLWPPGSGDPCSRLVGIRIGYCLGPGATVDLAQTALTDVGVPSSIYPLTSMFTADNTVRSMFIDLSGDLRVDAPVQTDSPVWMSGETRRRAQEPINGSGFPQGLSLKIVSGTGTNAIYSVQWVVAEGW